MISSSEFTIGEWVGMERKSCGNGWGWKSDGAGMNGDGYNWCGNGWGWVNFPLPCRSQ